MFVLGLGFCEINFEINVIYSPLRLICVFFLFMMHFLTDAIYNPENTVLKEYE